MSESPPPRPGGGETERLRAGLLRLKGALHDRVTGLYSYHLHVDDLHALADGGRVGVVALDFPSLAALEAAYGWETSDRFLAEVAAYLNHLKGPVLPDAAFIALDGVHGDSFLLFVHQNARGEPLAEPDLPILAGALDDCLRQHLLKPGSRVPLRVEFALGWALVSDSPAARFERRLHQAIREARGMSLRLTDRQQGSRAAELRAILTDGRITTHYQPIVDMDEGTIMGYEALARGPRDTAFEGPDVLFAGCHEVRLLPELDRVCRCQAVRNARGFDPRQKLFLNALPESLSAPGFTDGGFLEAIRDASLEPRNVVLEITERSSIHDFEAFERHLGPLRRQGFLVAIDDVGTGYSSLQTITEVQPDFIKIDMSLIKNIHRSLLKQELVHSLLQVGARIGAKVIAEGIEAEEEHRSLRRCGVRYGQGFYFARPAPPFPGLTPRAR